jgi:hypothetical protein
MTLDRESCLKEIVKFGENRVQATEQIATFDWDSEIELYTVTKIDIVNILNKFIDSTISDVELENWANFIECRDDLDYSKVAEFVFKLANPLVHGRITKQVAQNIISMLHIT